MFLSFLRDQKHLRAGNHGKTLKMVGVALFLSTKKLFSITYSIDIIITSPSSCESQRARTQQVRRSSKDCSRSRQVNPECCQNLARCSRWQVHSSGPKCCCKRLLFRGALLLSHQLCTLLLEIHPKVNTHSHSASKESGGGRGGRGV